MFPALRKVCCTDSRVDGITDRRRIRLFPYGGCVQAPPISLPALRMDQQVHGISNGWIAAPHRSRAVAPSYGSRAHVRRHCAVAKQGRRPRDAT